jgi:hypothetical protein
MAEIRAVAGRAEASLAVGRPTSEGSGSLNQSTRRETNKHR